MKPMETAQASVFLCLQEAAAILGYLSQLKELKVSSFYVDGSSIYGFNQ